MSKQTAKAKIKRRRKEGRPSKNDETGRE
jgi:hypothetical protein